MNTMKLLHYPNRLEEVVGDDDFILNVYHGDVALNMEEIIASLQSFADVRVETYIQDGLVSKHCLVTVITYR